MRDWTIVNELCVKYNDPNASVVVYDTGEYGWIIMDDNSHYSYRQQQSPILQERDHDRATGFSEKHFGSAWIFVSSRVEAEDIRFEMFETLRKEREAA